MMSRITTVLLLASSVLGAHDAPQRRHGTHGAARRSFDLVQREERDLQHQLEERNDTAALEKRDSFTGRGTFFYVGLGACGQYSSDNDLMVALNSAQYGGGYPGPQCFKTITVQANGVTVGGVTILDECPTCDYGGLDMSPGLFTHFADEGVGELSITWWFDDGSSPAPTTSSTYQAPTTTWTPPTSTWVAPTSTYTPPAPTSTWVAPTTTSSTWSPPPSTSTSSWAMSTSSSSVAPSSSVTSSTMSSALASSLVSTAANATSTNPYAIVQTYNGTTATASASAAVGTNATTADGHTSNTGGSGSPGTQALGNLVLVNGLVANYGGLIVLAAKQVTSN